MPVFTFEKISSPIRRVDPAAPDAGKPRSVIVQFLDRFVEARVRRTAVEDNSGQPNPQKSEK
jgi:hypothetical protein